MADSEDLKNVEDTCIVFGGESGMREECGLFGIVATGDWPTDIHISHLIHLGLVGLQHRYDFVVQKNCLL